MLVQQDFNVKKLGECTIQSPLKGIRFVDEKEHILYHRDLDDVKAYLVQGNDPPVFEAAGPREKIFFDPANLSCGIVTLGGTILASSRGNQDASVMVDTLDRMKIGILFCIGGDGT
ncbi:MAG: hypothetical protein V2B15_05900 [Bacteroidota bacterium]